MRNVASAVFTAKPVPRSETKKVLALGTRVWRWRWYRSNCLRVLGCRGKTRTSWSKGQQTGQPAPMAAHGGHRDYFRGAENAKRVRDWRQAHPGYWKRKTP